MPGFPSLPRELRDEIYSFLWQQSPMVLLTNASGIPVTAWYGQLPVLREIHYQLNIPGLPVWLLVSKTILQEGAEAFERKGTVVMEIEHSMVGSPRREYKPEAFSTILSPLTAPNLHVFLPYMNIANAGDLDPPGRLDMARYRKYIDYFLYPHDVRYMAEFMEDLAMSGMTKGLKFDTIFYHHSDRWRIQTASFNALNVIAPLVSGLRSFEFVIHDHELSPGSRQKLDRSIPEEMEELRGELFEGMDLEVHKDCISDEINWRFEFTRA